jgi:HSP20 family protein
MLVPWSPFQELMSWHRDIDDLFDRFFSSPQSEQEQETRLVNWVPSVETLSKDGQYVVRLDVPGVDPKDVEVSVQENNLIIKGERKSSHETKEKDYHYREAAYGRFERRLALPQGVDRDKVTASYKNGVLEISVPRPVALAGKTIPIQIEEVSKKMAAA